MCQLCVYKYGNKWDTMVNYFFINIYMYFSLFITVLCKRYTFNTLCICNVLPFCEVSKMCPDLYNPIFRHIKHSSEYETVPTLSKQPENILLSD